MRIGILTFHRAKNYGAVLQCYSLQTFLEDIGNEIEIIDYVCPKLDKTYKTFYLKSFSPQNIASAIIYYPIRKNRNKVFRQFVEKELHLSLKTNLSSNEIEEYAQKYDLCVVGSDQVWRTDITDADNNFFLTFVPKEKRVSYAASLGTIKFDNEMSELYKKYLSDFREISIREEINQNDLSLLLKKDINVNIDPVFLIEAEKWERFIEKDYKKKNYIFVYSLHEKSCYTIASDLKKKSNKEIIAIPDSVKTKFEGKRDFKASVYDFLNYIYHADFVVTDSFHATAFSIIFKKSFFTVLKSEKVEQNGRIESLLSKLGLENRMDIKYIEEKIHFDKAFLTIKEEREKAKHYFENI